MSVAEHRKTAVTGVRCAVLTISDTRAPETDVSGRAIVELLEAAGHVVAKRQMAQRKRGTASLHLARTVTRRSQANRISPPSEDNTGDAATFNTSTDRRIDLAFASRAGRYASCRTPFLHANLVYLTTVSRPIR